MMCFLNHKEPLDPWYALVSWLCQCCISVNFPHLITYYIDLPSICSCANVRHWIIVICFNCLKELIVWLRTEIKTWMKATFSWMKIHSFVQHAGNHILGLGKFKHFLDKHAPRPARKRGLMALCLYCQVLLSNLLATSVFIETSEQISQLVPIKTLLKML